MRKLKNNFIDAHVAYVYKDICRQEIWNLSAQGYIWPCAFERVGRWWDSQNNEIDLAATDLEGKNLLLGECKFWAGPVGVVARLLAKSAFHPHGIKVMLEDGQVGRVQEILEP